MVEMVFNDNGYHRHVFCQIDLFYLSEAWYLRELSMIVWMIS